MTNAAAFISGVVKPFIDLAFQWLNFEIFRFPIWSYLLGILLVGSFLALFRVGNNSAR